jgi:hypothetical protein
VTTVISRFYHQFRAILEAGERRGIFNLSLLMGDGAVAAWLLHAFHVFQGRASPSGWHLAAGGLAVAALACLLRLHVPPAADGLKRLLVRTGGFAAALAGAMLLTRFAGGWRVTAGETAWLAATTALALFVLRIAYFAFRTRHFDQPMEMARWLILAGGATALFLPYYHNGRVGTGDAQWYTGMLADYVTQLRAGVFPVWVGQSEYAFNGAVSPLRFAPWFQYAGGLLDMATWHALDFTGLKNALLAVNGLAGGFAAYFCLRDVLHRRPGLACVLGLLYLSSPGVLAPLIAGDQYMTFMATPFIPLILNGAWRLWTRDDFSGPMRLSTGLAGIWLSHAPIALWTTLFATGTGVIMLVCRRKWTHDLRRMLLAAVLFAALGSLPFVSMLSIDNRSHSMANGGVAVEEVAKYFPDNFKPINLTGAQLTMYQVGYASLAAFMLAVSLLPKHPPRATWLFIGATVAIIPIVLPVPVLNKLFWIHAPAWFVTINNVWPMQRLFGFWAALMLFTLAVVAADQRIAGRTALARGCLVVCLVLGVWSWHEAAKLCAIVKASFVPAATQQLLLNPSNVILTRYSYASFSKIPAYLSHGYMDPLLENRILSQDTLAVMTTNADRAAPPLPANRGSRPIPRLMQSGVLTAIRKQNGEPFALSPELNLTPGLRYALRIQVFDSATFGVLELSGRGLFRQYLLPDSGQGLILNAAPRSFGTLESSSKVMPLSVAGNGPPAAFRFVTQGYNISTRFSFGYFWLYAYDLRDLAVKVDSWIPYRARVEVATPAYLETPRVWLGRYRARVNGKHVDIRRSPDDLVMIPLNPGASTVELIYTAPWWLQTVLWGCVGSWVTLVALHLRRMATLALQFTDGQPKVA